MSTPSSAREALLVELMGEVATLLDRVDALIPALNDCCDAVSRATADMEAKAQQAQGRIVALADAANTHAIKHIARTTETTARSTLEAQTRAMQTAAQELFRTELAAALRQLSLAINRQAALLSTKHPWWVHAATATCASLITSALTIYLLAR